jgi:hypothetical protein
MGLTEFSLDSPLQNLDRVQTGDIILCSNEPRKGSFLIMTTTRSIWVHVGIAVWSTEGQRRLLIFESTRGKREQDELTGEVRNGVRLTDIRNIIEQYQVIHVRHLNVPRTTEFLTSLQGFMTEWQGREYISLIKIPLIPFVCFEDPGVSCSELVARFFKSIGLFDSRPELNNYCLKNFIPSHFAPGTEFSKEMSNLFANDNSPVIFHMGYFGMDIGLLLCIIAFIILGIHIIFSVESSFLKMGL